MTHGFTKAKLCTSSTACYAGDADPLSPEGRSRFDAPARAEMAGRLRHAMTPDFDALKWATSMLRVGPPPQPRSILQKMREAWDGEESKGGDIRGDSKGTRVRQRYNQGSRAQAGSAPTDGSAGIGDRATAGAQG